MSLACMLSITVTAELSWRHITWAVSHNALEHGLEGPLTTVKAPRGSGFTCWEPLPQSMYYLIGQVHNLQNVLSPMAITRNTAINHLHVPNHKRNTQFHGEVLGRGNEFSHEEVIRCGYPVVCRFWAQGFLLLALRQSFSLGGRDMRILTGGFLF